MADTTKRLHYFNGQFLEESDFNDEQEYHLDRARRHNRLLHTYGIAEGLTVTGAAGAGDVSVSPGSALDGQGRMIVLDATRTLTLATFANKTVYVVISYDEIGVDPATVGNQGQPTRWEERPKVELVDSAGAPSADSHIRLAKVTVSGGGTVGSIDNSERQLAGVRVGNELAIPRLRLSNPNFDESLWPTLTSDDASSAYLAGDLTVSGKLTNNAVDAHLKDNNNPHGVTAAQVGAPVNIGGVTNPGGAINIVAGTGLGVAADNTANKRITISGSTVGGVSNPGGDIGIAGASGITITPDNTAGNKRITITGGAPTNIGGVTAPGATVNFVGGNNISITADNTANKRLTIASATVAGVSNPGGNIAITGSGGITVSGDNGAAKQITITGSGQSVGGVTNAGGNIGIIAGSGMTVTPDNGAAKQITFASDIGKRTIVNVYFSSGDADGATKTVTLGFQPKLVWSTSSITGYISYGSPGGISHGFATLEGGTITQNCTSPYPQRYGSAPYVVPSASFEYAAIAAGLWWDATTSPTAYGKVSVQINSVNATGMVLKLIRSSIDGYTQVGSFSIYMSLCCVGS